MFSNKLRNSLVNIFPIQRFTIHGNSMFPTLKSGQDILCFNWAYFFSKPKRGDMVVLKHGGKELVKRIQKVHDRELFIQGDNQEESTDSRNFGLIKRSEIIGKVVFVR